MVFDRKTVHDYLVSKKLPLNTTSIEIPVYSTVSAFKFETTGDATVMLSGKMNLNDNYTNLALIDQNFDVVMNGENGIFTADIGGLTYIKLTISGDPKNIIYAFIE